MATDSTPTQSVSIKSDRSDAKSEIHEYLELSYEQHKLFPRAALVGACAGVVAIIFRALLSAADHLRNALIGWTYTMPYGGWVFVMLFGAAGALIATTIVSQFAPEAGGSGIPHLKAVLHRLRDLSWGRVLAVKMISGVFAIGSGLALGREGPTVQMGGAVADGIAGGLGVTRQDRLTLMAAGAGAGLAAAFNAPLSGLVFVLEEMQRDFRPAVFGAAFVAAVSADVVTRSVSGQLPVFSVPHFAMPPLSALPVFALLGVVAGVLGVAFNRALVGTLNLIACIPRRWKFGVSAAIGALAGLLGWFSPSVISSGQDLAEAALTDRVSLLAVPVLFIVRFGLTLTSYGTGAAGGIFAPLLVLGALLGLSIGKVVHIFMPALGVDNGIFAVVGMAAYFTAIVRAPLTGILLISEMTGGYEQMLPLLAASFCAYGVAEYLRDLPIYEALLERDLSHSGVDSRHEQPIVVHFLVEPRSRFAGLHVRQLGLPAGCVIVHCQEDGREWVPTAATRLDANMRITVVVAPDADGALELLRRGCARAD